MIKNKFSLQMLKLKPLSERKHDLSLAIIKELEKVPSEQVSVSMRNVGNSISSAREKNASVVMMIGAHVIRAGMQKYIIDLMEKGYISCLAMNGAGVIHDYELALIGATTESVARYIKDGQFGLWNETGYINDIIKRSYDEDKTSGMGWTVGRAIKEGDYPYKDISLLAAGYRLNIPITVHVGIGYDIIHQHPNCDAAATGALSYNDFLSLAFILQHLENGVVMNFGSAVMAPEVFLKALSMARNVAAQNKDSIRHFTTLVCDLHDFNGDFSAEPQKSSPTYYYRPWKTMLVRTVADGGKSYYVKGRHEDTISALWTAIAEIEKI